MLPKYEIHVEQGDVKVNHVSPLIVREHCMFLVIDTKHKYPESSFDNDVEHGVTDLEISFYADEETLIHSDERKGKVTSVEINVEGDWRAFLEPLKYGANVYLIRKMPDEHCDENWVAWHAEE